MMEEKMLRWKNGGGYIMSGAKVDASVFIGPGSRVYGTVKGDSVIHDNSVINKDAVVVDSNVFSSRVAGKIVGSTVRDSSFVGVGAYVMNSTVESSQLCRFASLLCCSLIKCRVFGKLTGACMNNVYVDVHGKVMQVRVEWE